MIGDVLQHRDLLYMLTWKEIRIRYKQSVMGFLWAILMPMLIVASGILVKKAFSMTSGRPVTWDDLLSVSIKGLFWAFFAGAVRFGTVSLVSNASLVTKIYFPREILPLSNVLSSFFDFVVAGTFLAILAVLTPMPLSINLAWLPLIIVILFLITTSFAVLLSCANLFFRDVKYLVDVIITFGVLFTPVFYSAKMLGKYALLILLNPVSVVLESVNDVVILRRAPDPWWLSYAALWGVLGTLIAWKIFEKAEPAFAQEV